MRGDIAAGRCEGTTVSNVETQFTSGPEASHVDPHGAKSCSRGIKTSSLMRKVSESRSRVERGRCGGTPESGYAAPALARADGQWA